MRTTIATLIGGVLLGGIVLGGALPAAAASKAKAAPADPVEARITQLHGDLHIAAEQETQWNQVAQMMRDNGKAMDDLHQRRTSDKKVLGAVEELKSYQELIDAHAEGVRKFIPVFQSLYDGMSAEQKKTADGVFRSRIMAAAKRTP